MIQGTYYKEWSTVLGREMEFKVYGHAGVPVLALPARGGRFYDWENNGMPDAIAQLLNEGKVQLFCADAMDGEGLLNGDLPQRRRAEQSVHQGMREHVRIGVTVQPALERNFHAAEDELAPRNEAVYIISVSDPHVVLPFQIASAMRRSTGVVIFKFSTSPGVRRTGLPAASMAEQSSVSGSPCAMAQRSTERISSVRKTCGVWTANSVLRSGVSSTRPLSARLMVS